MRLALLILAVLAAGCAAPASPATTNGSSASGTPACDAPTCSTFVLDSSDMEPAIANGSRVLAERVSSASNVLTAADGAQFPARFGGHGDVISFHPDGGRTRDRVVHRALAYVEVVGSGDAATYRLRWGPDPCPGSGTKDPQNQAFCAYGSAGIDAPDLGLGTYKPSASGFVTKGDNAATGATADQAQGLPPVAFAWIEGKVMAVGG